MFGLSGPLQFLIVCLLSACMFHYVGACSRSTGTGYVVVTRAPEPASHQLECNEEEVYKTDCLNGGTCFAAELPTDSKIQPERQAFCKCPSEWQGVQCEQRFFDIELWELVQAKTVMIVVPLVLIPTLICLIIVVVVCFYYKRRSSGYRPNLKSEESCHCINVHMCSSRARDTDVPDNERV